MEWYYSFVKLSREETKDRATRQPLLSISGNMAQLIWLAALFLIMCLISSAAARVALAQRGVLLAKWRTDLRPAVGSKPLPRVFTSRSGIELKYQPITSLWFTDNNTIAATFLTRESQINSALPRRGDQNLPLRLRGVFLDTERGKITAIRDWPTQSTLARIVAAEDGKFVTQRGDELTLYGPDLQQLKETNLPPAHDQDEWVAGPASPTGRSILVRLLVAEGRLESWRWVEIHTLQITHSWEAQPRAAIVSITDNRILRDGICACAQDKLELRGLSTEWTIIGPGLFRDIFFLNDDLFFMPNFPIKPGAPALIVRSDGEVLFTYKQPSEGGVFWRRAVPSTEGKRFVIIGVRSEGKQPVLDISGHWVLKRILVGDLSSGAQPYALDVKGPKISGQMQFALSPNGLRLAVLNKETVQVFDLPPLQ